MGRKLSDSNMTYIDIGNGQKFELSVADKFMTDSFAHLASLKKLSKPVDPLIDLFLHTGKKHSFSNGPSLSSPG